MFRVLRSALWEQKFEGFERFESLKGLKDSALTEIIQCMHIKNNHLSGDFLVVS